MEDVFLNYEHIPVQKGFDGKKTIRKEITWITQDRTYEDVTSVLPVYNSGRVDSVVVITMSIEDLKTTIAHATGYSSRYSLYSMVGNSASSRPWKEAPPASPAGIITSCSKANRVRASSVLPTVSIRQVHGLRLRSLRCAVTKDRKRNWKKDFWQDRWYGPSGSQQFGTGQWGNAFP